MNKNKTDIKQIKQQIQKSSALPKSGKPAYKVPEKTVKTDDTLLRPTQLVPVKLNRMVAWAVFAFTLIIYLLTQARSLSFWDSGEYATCVSIFGVPHPPGNPFYVIFGKALVSIFGGFISHAWIAAFISGLVSAFAVMLTYLITVQLTSMIKIKHWESVFASVIAALFTAFSFTFWMNAVEAEVYSGLVLFVNLIIWITLWWVQHSRDFHHQNYLLLILYLFFVGFSVHQTALQIAPAILFIAVYPLLHQGSKRSSFWYKVVGYGVGLILTYLIFQIIGKGLNIDALDQIGFALGIGVIMMIELRKVIDRRVWLLGILMIILGVSAHVYLPIRAADSPFINLGNPSTQESFVKYLTRDQYGQTSMFERRGNLFTHQMGYHFFRYFSWQWFKPDTLHRMFKIPELVTTVFGGLLIAFLGLFGAVFHFKGNKHSFLYFLSIVICTTVLMVFVMNLSSQEVRDRDYFFVVAYNMWAIWMGVGALAVLSLFREKSVRIAMVAILALIPVLNMVLQYHEHDRSRELIALDYGVNLLNSLEENAIIFTNGDNDTYPLWYAQAVHDKFAKEYVHKARDIYPTSVSQAAIKKAMDYKNAQLKGIRKDVTIANFSLLNTSWYIKHLKEHEGVIINWDNNKIDNLEQGVMGQTVSFNGGGPGGKMDFSIDYSELRTFSAPTRTDPRDQLYHPSDQAVIQIVKDNYGKRPIYFAVTCDSNIGFDDHIRNEGMVYRIVPTKDEFEQQIDVDRLLTNIDKVYQYRSIFDKRVFKDDNMTRLIVNYGAAYNRAAVHFTKQKELGKALKYANQAKRFMGDNYEIKMLDFYTRYYAASENYKEFNRLIDTYIFPLEDTSEDSSPYNKYVLLPIAQQQPDMIGEFLAKAFNRYENNDRYLYLAYHYAKNYNLKPQIDAMFSSMGQSMVDKWNDAWTYLQNPEYYDKQAAEADSLQDAA